MFRVAPMTASPGPFSTGRLSPVSMLSSRAERPSVTTPSTGTFSPGADAHQVAHRAPARTGTSVSTPSRRTRAVRAWRPIRALIAAPVCCLARASSQRPRRTRAMMITAVSK